MIVEAFIDAALNLKTRSSTENLSISVLGVCVTIGELTGIARTMFGIQQEPQFTMPARSWDVQSWYANPQNSAAAITWQAHQS